MVSLISNTAYNKYFFFFQAEDGIRDRNVTGVQTCALPISEAIGYGVRERTPDAAPYIAVYLCTARLVPDNRRWCFRAPSRAAVRAFHQAALAHGGIDDGPP